MSWKDPARVELLKKLWADGLSCSIIAARLGGVTRNAVIGKVSRLGLTGRITTHRQPTRPKAAMRRARIAGLQRAKLFLSPVQKLKGEPFVPQPEPVIPPHERQPILVRKDDGLHANDALTPESCRWPCGDVGDADFGFCGHTKVPGLPYCAPHARIAFNATNPQPRKLRLIVNAEPQKVSA